MHSIRTERLTRRFGERLALNELSVSIPDDGVIGLVGPNGSGKSTLIRILVGLICPSDGSAEVLGTPIDQQTTIASQVGALIENPAFIPALSARRNLASLAILRGLPPERVDQVLETVALSERDREPVKGFSLGMKQRLGIAAALLPDPRLLVLDEPTNGLDPAGIVEIRQLLKTLGRSGRTVIVSSHMLSEIQAVCDFIVIVRYGELVFAGPIAQLLSQAREYIEVAPERSADTEPLRHLLMHAGWDVSVTASSLLRVTASPGQSAAINRTAVEGGILLARLAAQADTLEDVFLRLTGPHARADELLVGPGTDTVPPSAPVPSPPLVSRNDHLAADRPPLGPSL